MKVKPKPKRQAMTKWGLLSHWLTVCLKKKYYKSSAYFEFTHKYINNFVNLKNVLIKKINLKNIKKMSSFKI